MSGMHYDKSFYLIVSDRDNETFSVEGPMADDRPWNRVVVAAQKSGRRITLRHGERARLPRMPLVTGCNGIPESGWRQAKSSIRSEEAARMHSTSPEGQARRRRAEERFKSAKPADSKNPRADYVSQHVERQAEAEKTARLRGLRLAKEAADKEIADREAASALASKPEPRRRAPRAPASTP